MCASVDPIDELPDVLQSADFRSVVRDEVVLFENAIEQNDMFGNFRNVAVDEVVHHLLRILFVDRSRRAVGWVLDLLVDAATLATGCLRAVVETATAVRAIRNELPTQTTCVSFTLVPATST